jgi:hypothetical protein
MQRRSARLLIKAEDGEERHDSLAVAEAVVREHRGWPAAEAPHRSTRLLHSTSSEERRSWVRPQAVFWRWPRCAGSFVTCGDEVLDEEAGHPRGRGIPGALRRRERKEGKGEEVRHEKVVQHCMSFVLQTSCSPRPPPLPHLLKVVVKVCEELVLPHEVEVLLKELADLVELVVCIRLDLADGV